MSASMQQHLPRPEQLADLVGTAAVVQLAMQGKFDDRIKELKDAQAALEEAQAIAKTLDEAKAIRDLAVSKASDADTASAKMISEAQSTLDRAKSRETIVSAREQAVAGRESAADTRQSTQDRREQAILDAQTAADNALTAREAAVKKAEGELSGRRVKLEADIRAFNQRLEALKA